MDFHNSGVYLLLLTITCSKVVVASRPDNVKPPNVILFVADDMGYGDLSVYGHPTQEWGAIDKLATEGMRFTQFYSVTSMCTPSRTSMLTGRLPMRSGMDGNAFVSFPCQNVGLPHSEITVAEAMRDAGYTTGMVGKWHQGINAYDHNDGTFLPHSHGFDNVGHILPFTLHRGCDTSQRSGKKVESRLSFLFRNTTIVQQPIQLETLTTTLLHDAKAFLYENHDRPFFFFYSFPQPHIPMFNMEKFSGSSKRGIYGDQINEMAWAVSEIMSLLKELHIENDTLSLFVSDHGPHLEMCEESGSAGLFYGAKANFQEGGVRIPAIAHWPGTIPAGITSAAVVTFMDLFSTLIELSGGTEPSDRHIDSQSFAHLLRPASARGKFQRGTDDYNSKETQNENLKNSDVRHLDEEIHKIIFFYCVDRTLTAVRYKQYKIYLRLIEKNMDEAIAKNCNGSLPIDHYHHSWCTNTAPIHPWHIYNVEEDPGENFLLHSEEYKDMLEEVQTLIEQYETTLVDIPEPILVKENCHIRHLPCCNPPYCLC